MKDDTTIQNILISTRDAEMHPAVIGGLAGKRNRSLERSSDLSSGDFRKLFDTMELVEVHTPTGINLGKEWAFDLDKPIMNRFMERLSRAILSYDFDQTYFSGAFEWRMNVEISPLVYEVIQRFGHIRRVCDIFSYGVTPLRDDGPSWLIVNFYRSIELFIRVENAE